MNGDYNPHSHDSMFGRIMQRLDQQDATLTRIEAGVTKTNVRVDSLEKEKWVQRGFVAAISLTMAGIWHWATGK